jgi:photosystem II stability/assembly factor-like uncharacterized protein
MTKYFTLLVLLVAIKSQAQFTWKKLTNAPTNGGKQDDVFFTYFDTGWSVNGSGRIYKTTNGGNSWIQQRNLAGTYFRCIGFINNQYGFAGNIGPDYFPGVTDTVQLYRTIDGGNSWSEVTTIAGPSVKGLCAINVVSKDVIYAGGRVGGPSDLIKSTDGGQTWHNTSLKNYCASILDVKFFSPDTGFVFCGTASNVDQSSAAILYTTDGGKTFAPVYTSNRPYEMIWKASFPTRNVGYATVQTYDPNATQRYVVKTIDGGKTWQEIPMTTDAVREFGIGFITEDIGWVGTESSGYQTLDGGQNWTKVTLGRACNKIRLLKTDSGFVGYGIGLDVYKIEYKGGLQGTTKVAPNHSINVYPNPASKNFTIEILADNQQGSTTIDLLDINGRKVKQLHAGQLPDAGKLTVDIGDMAQGLYLLKIQLPGGVLTQKIQLQ